MRRLILASLLACGCGGGPKPSMYVVQAVPGSTGAIGYDAMTGKILSLEPGMALEFVRRDGEELVMRITERPLDGVQVRLPAAAVGYRGTTRPPSP